MTISYKWLSEYLPVTIEPERLSRILTSVGLEVEKMETFEAVKGNLEGLVIGEVLHTEQHPNADKLKLTKVNAGARELQIVCGAPNVAAGQKVVVAPVGSIIYPTSGEPITMKVAKIRGVESFGMICAENEIGLGSSHAGIMVLPAEAKVGTKAADYFQPYTDIIYEIGLTPNRMDAMSHWGVARDVCAYLSHHDKKELKSVLPKTNFKVDNHSLKIDVEVENTTACRRYAGVCLSNIQVKPSPKWLQDHLVSIGLRPINNIVDITNFIQHETGQPLHAFDYDTIGSKKVIVKTLATGTSFTTLDEKQRSLTGEDLMICDADGPMCIAGVFGGLHSGVSEKTINIFLESAYFDPVFIRKTSFRHGLRTDAATRFEKGIDISNTVNVLKRAAMLMKELAGAQVASEIVDIYPDPQSKTEVTIKYHYLKKLSGKNYHPDTVKNILQSLGFILERESLDALTVAVPFHKPDVSLPADIVEEVLRIDGLDNIEIPTSIRISPAVDTNYFAEALKEKVSNVLTGLGFSEIITNSITNSAYFSEQELQTSVRLLNNLSTELNLMRPSMLHTALEVISFNTNRKNTDLKLFEFGKTYASSAPGKYTEDNHLCLYITGQLNAANWKAKPAEADIYFIKGIAEALLKNLGVADVSFTVSEVEHLQQALTFSSNNKTIATVGKVMPALASRFDIRQSVLYCDINWDGVLELANRRISYREISKYPAVERDLAMLLPKSMAFSEVQQQISSLKLKSLQSVKLFDVFESEKIGADKKSLAINFTFLDAEKTLTDKEIDGWMNKIMSTLESQLSAEIRK
jgi:phenylalanyl-tRNA synthetase beta chain